MENHRGLAAGWLAARSLTRALGVIASVDFLASSYFGNEFSRRWWNMARKGYAEGEGEDFVARIDAALDASDPNRQKQVIDALQKSTN